MINMITSDNLCESIVNRVNRLPPSGFPHGAQACSWAKAARHPPCGACGEYVPDTASACRPRYGSLTSSSVAERVDLRASEMMLTYQL